MIASEISGKVWGKTQKIFDNGAVSVHRIFAMKGGYSSMHKHQFRFNMFYVESGSMKIVTRKNDYDLTDETIIGAGQTAIAKPNEWHKFEALADTVAFEIYYGSCEDGDIIREGHGGVYKFAEIIEGSRNGNT